MMSSENLKEIYTELDLLTSTKSSCLSTLLIAVDYLKGVDRILQKRNLFLDTQLACQVLGTWFCRSFCIMDSPHLS